MLTPDGKGFVDAASVRNLLESKAMKLFDNDNMEERSTKHVGSQYFKADREAQQGDMRQRSGWCEESFKFDAHLRSQTAWGME